MPYQPPPTIKRGSRGPYVAYCQNLLNARLSAQAPLWVDGIFGLKTEARVRQYQTAKRLLVDGIVGPQTWAALEAGTLDLPAGKTELRTFLYDEAGKPGGAYFTEVEAL